jgi:hypothetical protein
VLGELVQITARKQRMLGHARAPMTLDTYPELFDEDLDAVAVGSDGAIRAAADCPVQARLVG